MESRDCSSWRDFLSIESREYRIWILIERSEEECFWAEKMMDKWDDWHERLFKAWTSLFWQRPLCPIQASLIPARWLHSSLEAQMDLDLRTSIGCYHFLTNSHAWQKKHCFFSSREIFIEWMSILRWKCATNNCLVYTCARTLCDRKVYRTT